MALLADNNIYEYLTVSAVQHVVGIFHTFLNRM